MTYVLYKSFLLTVCLSVRFLWIGSLVFFWNLTESRSKWCMTETIFLKGILNFIKKFFFWIWSTRKVDFLFSCTNPMSGKNQVPEIWADMLLSNQIAGFFKCKASRKKWEIELNFCLKIFCKLILSFLVGLARHTQSTRNNKFVLSLKYLKEEVRNEVDILLADKHQSFLQGDAIIIGGCGQACPEYWR